MDAEVPPDSPVAPGLTKHYEGYLEKKGPRDKDYEKQWIILLGDRMLAYPQRVAQREINSIKPTDSFVINTHTDIKPDSKEKTKLTIKCREGVYKFKMNTQDERDNWWIRFHALAKMEIPKVHLLPGQIIALQEIIENTQMSVTHYSVPSSIPVSPNQIKIKSTTTKAPTTKSPTTKTPTTKTFVKRRSQEDINTDLNKQYRFYPEQHLKDFKDDCPIPPTWFFQVSRLQAEELLLNNRESGAILIRDSEAHTGFSLSMRQDPPRGNTLARPVIKHFRFVWENHTYRMLIEEVQPPMPTMYNLLAFFIDKHGGDIKPMQTRDPSVLKQSQHPYELGLRVAGKDPENGEPRRDRDTYLQPVRAAPEPPAGRPRPDRQSLPASFNMSYKQGESVEPAKKLHYTSEPTSTSPYMVPESSVSMYVNVGRDTLKTIREGRRDSPPQLPPPRQRCVSASMENSPNLTNKESVYNAPDGQNFVLQRHSAELPMTTRIANSKPGGNRLRSYTSPGNSSVPNELSKIFKKFNIDSEK